MCVCVCVCVWGLSRSFHITFYPSTHASLWSVAVTNSPLSSQSARINVSTIEGGAVTSLTVRPWLDTVNNLQARVFATGTPSQRQQLFVRGERLQDDGRVLAQLGVNTGCTIHLVSA